MHLLTGAQPRQGSSETGYHALSLPLSVLLFLVLLLLSVLLFLSVSLCGSLSASRSPNTDSSEVLQVVLSTHPFKTGCAARTMVRLPVPLSSNRGSPPWSGRCCLWCGKNCAQARPPPSVSAYACGAAPSSSTLATLWLTRTPSANPLLQTPVVLA